MAINAPSGSFPAPNKIELITRGRREELPATGTIPVGSICMSDGAGGVVVHNVRGGRAERMFAIEQQLRGLYAPGVGTGAFDNYVSGDIVSLLMAAEGDEIQLLLAKGQVATDGAFLCSYGDGSFMILPNGASQLLYESVAASAEIANTITETLFGPQYTVPANFLQAGDILRIRGQAIADLTNATDTLNLKLYIGGLAGINICATGAVDVANNDEGLFEANVVIRTVGATGTLVANGYTALGTPGTVTAKPFLKASTTIDTTAAQLIGVSATWSAANAGDSVRLDQLSVELERGGGLVPLAVARDALDNSAGSGAVLLRARVL